MVVLSRKKPHSLTVVFNFLLLFAQMVEVESGGTMELTMNSFNNPTEHLYDGSCCDALCIGQCDDIFHFSMDLSPGNPDDPKSSFYWSKVTGTFQDQNNVVFNNDMRGVNNPIVWAFDSWPGTVLFKVYIEDDDHPYTANDYLDGMIQRLTLTPSRSKSLATSTAISIYGIRPRDKTVLSMTYKLYCDDNFYGPKCSVYCLAQDSNSTGHYTCDQDTGALICRTGWEDVSNNCRTFSDDCFNKNCHNGQCIDGVRSFSCSCNGGFTDTFCDSNIDECLSSPCQNRGTCSDLINGYTCACPSGFVGPKCEFAACAQTNPCINGGTCYGSDHCLCPLGYIGSRCELRTCDALPCANGGQCTANGTCLCTSAYIGVQCEVRKCDFLSDHCKNNGSCVDGVCVCQKPFKGVNCEARGCTDDICKNGGTCIETDDSIGFKCICTQQFIGQTCQSPETVCALPSNQQGQTKDGDDNNVDVTAFDGDRGILLIILILVCVILFIVLIVLIALMCYRRRKNKLFYDRCRSVSTTSTTQIVPPSISSVSSISKRVRNDYSVGSLDDVFCAGGGKTSPSAESMDKPWKKAFDRTNSTGSNSGQDVSGRAENQYERLDDLAEQLEVTVDQDDQGQETLPEIPERFVCKIKDIHGNSIRLAEKLADC